MWGFCSLTEAGSCKVSAGITWFLLRQKDSHSLWGSASTAPWVASHQQERSQEIPAPALQQESWRPTPLLPKCQDHITASNGVRRISSECCIEIEWTEKWQEQGTTTRSATCITFRGHPRIPSPKCLSHHPPSPGRSRPLGKGHLISQNPGILGHSLSSDVSGHQAAAALQNEAPAEPPSARETDGDCLLLLLAATAAGALLLGSPQARRWPIQAHQQIGINDCNVQWCWCHGARWCFENGADSQKKEE